VVEEEETGGRKDIDKIMDKYKKKWFENISIACLFV